MAVADRLANPIVKTLPGKAVVPDDHPLATSGIGLLGTRPSEEAMPLVGDSAETLAASLPLLRMRSDRSFLETAQAGDDNSHANASRLFNRRRLWSILQYRRHDPAATAKGETMVTTLSMSEVRDIPPGDTAPGDVSIPAGGLFRADQRLRIAPITHPEPVEDETPGFFVEWQLTPA